MKRPLRRKTRLLLALGVLALLASACAPDAPQDFINAPVGEQAREADGLWDFTFLIAVIVFVLVEGALVFTIFKFRRRPGREAAQFHGNTRLEIVLTLVPALILAGISIPTVNQIFAHEVAEEGALEVTVVARQFWWEYRYDADTLGTGDQELVTANELHVPTDRAVILHLEGAEDDVIHSFWVPKVGGTQDVVPGRTNRLVWKVEEPGTYLGQCKEFCGLSHANMRIRLVAQDPGAFETWVEEQLQPARPATAGDARKGEETFLQSACIGCHAIQGTDAAGRTGPDLTHVASRATFAGAMFRTNEENLRNWVSNAPGMKPGVLMPRGLGTQDGGMGLTPQQIDDIVAYLMTLD